MGVQVEVGSYAQSGATLARGQWALTRTAKAFRDAGFSLEVSVTASMADATEQARAAAPGSLVAVLGGDGFLGAAAAGAWDSGAVILPLAGGRGNDTVRRDQGVLGLEERDLHRVNRWQ